MISNKSFSEDHIRKLYQNSKTDPILLERTIYAFGLLEALAKSGLQFVFKGGTCLMFLFDNPRRLSTDIDIIVKPNTPIEEYLSRVAKIFPFKNVEEQIRIGKNNIVKRHFKFVYDSPINKTPFYILLDVLFEENLYSEIISKEIKNNLLLIDGPNLTVDIPSADCILADKLTAFAPHTTGIPLSDGKLLDVAKQFYDLTSLIDIFSCCENVLPTYKRIATAEISYRGLNISFRDCLKDSFLSAFCIASRGKTSAKEYPLYVRGIQNLHSHIYLKNFTSESAAFEAIKIMYLCACLLTGADYLHVTNANDYKNKQLHNIELSPLNYYRKVNLESYAYLILLDEIIINSNPFLFQNMEF